MKKVMKNKRVIAIVAVVVLVAALLASGVIASPPMGAGDPPVGSKINYQGQLTDGAGDPLDGTYDMEFLFYGSATGGSQVGSTVTKNDVEVDNGLFSVKLDVDQSDFNGQGLWLEVRVEGETLSPRQEILPVPYALSLKPGAEIRGETDNTIVKAENTGEGDAVLGIASGYDSIGVYGQSGFGTGVFGEGKVGVCGESSASDGRAVLGYASATSGYTYGVRGVSGSSDGTGVYGEAPRYGVYGESSASDGYGGRFVNTGGTVGTGVYGQSSFGTGVRGEGYTGVWGESSAGTGVYGEGSPGVHGMSDTGSGVYGKSSASTGRGVYGEAPMYGVYGRATATSAFASGVYGTSSSDSGMGVYGAASAESGYTYGVYGRSDSPQGSGVSGYGTATNGYNHGVSGRSDSPDGYGVYGTAPTYGVYGWASGTGDSCHGVYGSTSGDWGWASGVYGKAYQDHANGVTGWNTAGGTGVYAWSEEGTGIVAKSGGSVFMGYDISPSENLRFQVSNDGNVYADGTYSSPASDFAEMLPAVEGLEPGDVLVVGPDGKLACSTQAYATNVVGVYSTQPGFVGGSSDDDDLTGKVPLAVVGMVPVKASAENGPIEPGDLLTTAFVAGQAMKATDLKVGTIIGKALESLDEGTGLINMLVMLQ